MILTSLKSGFAQMRAQKRMLLVFYLANLFFGLLMMLPLRSIVSDFIGNSEMGAKLGGPLDMDFLFEFFKHNAAAVSTFGGLILLIPAAAWLFTLFLSGGAFATFAGGNAYNSATFWGGCAKYFGRFLRLSLWSLPVLGVLFCLQYLETGVQRLIFGSDPYQNVTYWGGWIKTGLRGLGFLLFGLVLDYARIHMVLTGERKARLSLWQGIKFAFKNLPQTFSLAFILIVVGAVALIIYNPIANGLSAGNALIVLLLFVWQQLYMLFRAAMRLTLYASELQLYQGLTATATETKPAPLDDLSLEGLAPAME